MRITWSFKLAVCLIVLVMMAGCRSAAVYNVKEDSIPTYSNKQLSMEEVEKSIVAAAASLGWMTKRVDAGHMLATLNLRDHQAMADITYNQESFSINYKDSKNLNYDGKTIHSNYNGWIQRLEQTILANLSSQ